MDSSSAWLSELEMQDQGLLNQLQMIRPYYVVTDFSVDSCSSENNTKNPSLIVDQAFTTPSIITETTNTTTLHSYKSINDIYNKYTPTDEKPKPKPQPLPNIPNTFTISFGDPKPKDEFMLLNDSLGVTRKGQTAIRNRIQLQDHMLAERKRREKLAGRFVSLSALLPGLKKMDKAAVLEDASNYIRELQCRVKELEGLSDTKEENMQPTLCAKKSKLSCSNDDGSWSSDESNFGEIRCPRNPEIEVRILGSSVLVRIYCRKNYVSLVKVIEEIEKLGLSITSSSTLPFATTTFLITIIAKKKNDEFLMTSTDLVRNLQLAI